MDIIKMKIWDVIATRIILVIELIFVVIILFCFSVTKQFLDIPTYIFGALIIICLISQIILISGNNYVEFSNEGIIIFLNKKTHRIEWKDIVNPIFYSFGDMIVFRNNTLDFLIKEKNGVISFYRKFDSKQIYCTKKQFLKFEELFMQSK